MPAISRIGLALACGLLTFSLSACSQAHHTAGAASSQTTADATAAHVTSPGNTTATGQASTGKAPASAPVRGARLPAGVVARVGRNSITKNALERWIAVDAVMRYQPKPTRPVPAGVSPRPPGYDECIAYLAEIARAKRTRPADTAQLKEQCAREYAALQEHMLEVLIVRYWVAEEAARAGVALTSRDIRRALKREFPTAADFDRYLAFTGLHASDWRFVLEGELLPEKWHRTILPAYARLRRSKPPESEQMPAEIDLEVSDLTQSMTRRWTPRTRCKTGYVVTFCSEYRR